jgi:hypothetical protein
MRTQEWALEPWEGEDLPGLAVPWARKPKFSVNGSRSCAELAIVHHLRAGGWDGVWVNAFRGELRTQWFSAPAVRRPADAGAPGWAVEVFECLRAANGGTLSGFFDVFAWREPGQVGFLEAKVGPDRIKPTQLRFVEIALRFRSLEEFMMVEIAGPPSRPRTPARQPGTAAGLPATRRPVTAGPGSGGRDRQPPLRSPVPAGPGHGPSAVQRPRRTARWTADDVTKAVASSGDDAAAIARTVMGWAAGPHRRLAGGTGRTYPSIWRNFDGAGLCQLTRAELVIVCVAAAASGGVVVLPLARPSAGQVYRRPVRARRHCARTRRGSQPKPRPARRPTP